MKLASTNALYANDVITKRVTDYATEHSLPLPKHITDFHEWVVKNHARSDYMISVNQSQSNVFLSRMMGAKRVLEIGTFVGYSALVWAHAIGKEGKVTTLEFSPEYAGIARETFKKNGVENVEVVEGDALETLAKLNPDEPYDIVFIDAQKSGYPAYLQTILDHSQPGASHRLLRPGGIIIADNVLRRALVVDESSDNPWSDVGEKRKERSEYEKDSDLVRMREFNDNVAKTPRLEAFLMPLFDGVGLSRLLD